MIGFVFWQSGTKQGGETSGSATSTPIGADSDNMVFDMTTSDGTITFTAPSKDFGLAVSEFQILVHSYIPPCSQDFNYCLYYIGTDYDGTNFESGGLRIYKRTDLANERLCLNTPPEGFSSATLPSATKSDNGYSSSVFSDIGNAAAGHYSSGSLYRLYVKSNSLCYEFETTIGQSQFQNYPAGSIKEFTATDMKDIKMKLFQILNRVTLTSGLDNLFPQTASSSKSL